MTKDSGHAVHGRCGFRWWFLMSEVLVVDGTSIWPYRLPRQVQLLVELLQVQVLGGGVEHLTEVLLNHKSQRAGVAHPVGVGFPTVVPLTAHRNCRTVPSVCITSHATLDVGLRTLPLPEMDPFTRMIHSEFRATSMLQGGLPLLRVVQQHDGLHGGLPYLHGTGVLRVDGAEGDGDDVGLFQTV